MTKHIHGQVHSFVPSNNYLRVISVKTKIIMRAIIFVCYQACLYYNCNSTIMIICHVIICARLSFRLFFLIISQIARFMGPTWGPPGSCRPQMGPMLAPRTLLSGILPNATSKNSLSCHGDAVHILLSLNYNHCKATPKVHSIATQEYHCSVYLYIFSKSAV